MRLGDLDALKEALDEMFETFEVVLFDDIIAKIDSVPTVESDYARGFIDALDNAFSKFDANCTYSGDRVLQKLEKLKAEKGGAE